MAQETLVALYPRIENAEAARSDLEALGIPAADMAVQSRDTMSTVGEAAPRAQQQQSFFGWLFGSDVPEADRTSYRSHLDRNGAILSVRAESSRYDELATILDRHGPISLEEGDGQATTLREGASAESMAPGVVAGEPPAAAPGATARSAGTEEVIPTAKEELDISKQRVENTRAYSVRRYVVEHPVEEQVALHDEKVTVERRQPAQATVPGERPFEEKTVEVTESREEPVVRKTVRPGEDVVVRKEGQDRVETVSDTVRESKVDVDKAVAADKPPAAPERR